MYMMIRTNIYLTELQEKIIAEMIKTNKMGTKAQLVRNAIDEYIDKYRKYPPTTVSFGMFSPFISPGIPSWAEPLPNPTHIGRKVKVIKGNWAGKTGIVIEHWLNGDDCSGNYGSQLYQLDTHNYGPQNNSYGINVKDCELIN